MLRTLLVATKNLVEPSSRVIKKLTINKQSFPRKLCPTIQPVWVSIHSVLVQCVKFFTFSLQNGMVGVLEYSFQPYACMGSHSGCIGVHTACMLVLKVIFFFLS